MRLAIDVMKKWKSSGHPYIGRKVLRVFGDVRVSGTVTEYRIEFGKVVACRSRGWR